MIDGIEEIEEDRYYNIGTRDGSQIPIAIGTGVESRLVAEEKLYLFVFEQAIISCLFDL